MNGNERNTDAELRAWRAERLEAVKQTAEYQELAPGLQKTVNRLVLGFETPSKGIVASQTTMAKRLRVHRDTVNKHLQAVVEAGVFTREIQWRQGAGTGRGGRMPNRYRSNQALEGHSEADSLDGTEADSLDGTKRLSKSLHWEGVALEARPTKTIENHIENDCRRGETASTVSHELSIENNEPGAGAKGEGNRWNAYADFVKEDPVAYEDDVAELIAGAECERELATVARQELVGPVATEAELRAEEDAAWARGDRDASREISMGLLLRNIGPMAVLPPEELEPEDLEEARLEAYARTELARESELELASSV